MKTSGTYNPAKLAARNRTVSDLDDIQADFMRRGYAIIRAQERHVIKGRLAREQIRVTFRTLDNGRVKVTPKRE